jgi:hypothetical protein
MRRTQANWLENLEHQDDIAEIENVRELSEIQVD